MKEMVKDLKTEIEAIKKTQIKRILEMKNLGKWSGTTVANINNRVQEMEEGTSDIEDTIEEIDSPVKEMLNPTNS